MPEGLNRTIWQQSQFNINLLGYLIDRSQSKGISQYILRSLAIPRSITCNIKKNPSKSNSSKSQIMKRRNASIGRLLLARTLLVLVSLFNLSTKKVPNNCILVVCMSQMTRKPDPEGLSKPSLILFAKSFSCKSHKSCNRQLSKGKY